jgi:hypothetical protein
MTELLTTILPIALFWLLEALYLGGWPVDAHGGNGLRQVMGLLLTAVLWVVVWHALNMVLIGIGPVLGGIVLTTFVAAALMPLVNWIGFKIVGVSIRKVTAAH